MIFLVEPAAFIPPMGCVLFIALMISTPGFAFWGALGIVAALLLFFGGLK